MALGLGDVTGLALAEADGLGLTEAVGLADGDTDGLGLGDADAEALGLAEGLALGDAEGETLGDGDGLVDGEALGEALGDSEGSALGEAEAVGVSAEAEAFWGCEASLKTKSLALLSVSSPFPSVASPANMLSAVDPELAFLSALLLAAGAVIGVPSIRPLDTTPIPTASTTVPESAGPSLNATLLLSAIVALVLLSQPNEIPMLLLHHKKKPCAGITSSTLKATTDVSADPVAVLLTSLKSPSATSAAVGL